MASQMKNWTRKGSSRSRSSAVSTAFLSSSTYLMEWKNTFHNKTVTKRFTSPSNSSLTVFVRNPNTTSSSTPRWVRFSSKFSASSTPTKSSLSTSTLTSCKPVRAPRKPSPKKSRNYLRSYLTNKKPFLSIFPTKTSLNTSASASAKRNSPYQNKLWKTISDVRRKSIPLSLKNKTLSKVFSSLKFIEVNPSGRKKSWNSWLICQFKKKSLKIPNSSSPKSSNSQTTFLSLLTDDIV